MRTIGIFDKLFSKPQQEQQVQGYFKTLTAYSPVFTSFEGGIYEMELTRAAIHSFATQCSKLKPEIQGNAYKELGKRMQFQPNPFMDTTKFLYRLATILSVNNSAFIIPILAEDGQTITGYYPLIPSMCEVVEYQGKPYLRYTFTTGQKAAIEFEKVGILTQFQYRNDFFGESNAALNPTMQLIHTQNQGIIEGVKKSAYIRFIARMANVIRGDDLTAERKRFTEDNLAAENHGGVMMFDGKYGDVKQVDSKPFIVDAEQMTLIKNNVFNYFGTNEKILQNSFDENTWASYYEGKIEPFAIQLSLVMSNMTFTPKEIAFGNQFLFTANRLQYASNQTKLAIVVQLFDRGFMTHDMGLEIFNMAPLPNGEGSKYFIRKEYAEVKNLAETQGILGGDVGATEAE